MLELRETKYQVRLDRAAGGSRFSQASETRSTTPTAAARASFCRKINPQNQEAPAPTRGNRSLAAWVRLRSEFSGGSFSAPDRPFPLPLPSPPPRSSLSVITGRQMRARGRPRVGRRASRQVGGLSGGSP